MTLYVLSIPDNPEQWSNWLEEQLVGLHLGDVVEELQVMRRSAMLTEQTELLSAILTPEQLTNIAAAGLSSLDPATLRQLLRNAECLPQLQEHILIAGGEYWDGVRRPENLLDAVDRVRAGLSETDNITEETFPAARKPADDMGTGNRRGLLRMLTVSLVAIIGIAYLATQPSPSGRMLGQPGLLANNVSSSAEYLNRIADAGNQWFDQRPDSAADLIVLLEEVSSDCAILIEAPHEALSAAERDWFVTKCRNWKNKFDQTLAELKSGNVLFEEGRSQADATMKKLVDVLRAGPTA